MANHLKLQADDAGLITKKAIVPCTQNFRVDSAWLATASGCRRRIHKITLRIQKGGDYLVNYSGELVDCEPLRIHIQQEVARGIYSVLFIVAGFDSQEDVEFEADVAFMMFIQQ